MRIQLFALGGLFTTGLCFAQSTTDAGAVTPFRPVKGAHVVAPASQGGTALLVGGSDACSTPDVIAGTGLHAFDTTVATTGTEGQFNTNCIFFAQQGITNDVWFLWTAPSTGNVEFSTCGQTTVDTKMAIYNGAVCPPSGGGFTPAACNDDYGVGNLQTKIFLDVISGNQYLIQLGNFPTAIGGLGNLSIEYTPAAPVACGQWDDNSSEVGLRTGALGATICWLQRFGVAGDVTQVTTIQACWGTGFSAAGGSTGMTNGMPTDIAIWDDPNDDGNPADCVLLQMVSTVTANVDSDIYTPVPLTPAVTVNGVYFVGVTLVNPVGAFPANYFPIPLDADSCAFQPRIAWRAAQATGAFNFASLAANSTPPAAYSDIAIALNNNGFCGVLLLRADCSVPTNGTPFCAGDGTLMDHTTPCPCGNSGAAGNGCANSVNPAGANLDASGSTVADDVWLLGSGMPATVSCIYLQGDGLDDVTFGDGTRCTGGTLIRLRTRSNVGGASSFPDSTDTITLSARGGVVPGSGAVRHYQTYYRNSAALFCPPETFNVTNGRTITW